MTEEELKNKMINVVLEYQNPNPNEVWDEYVLIEQLLDLAEQYYREAGWKSPEDVTWIISQTIINRDKQLIEKGWKSGEEVKYWKSPKEIGLEDGW